MSATQKLDCIKSEPVLYVALELGEQKWKIGSTVGLGQKARLRDVPGGAMWALVSEIRAAKRKFGLGEDAQVVCCYEAGREGFWLHRFLESEGIENQIVDSSSIEVQRRRRRAKTDRLDVVKLLTMLIRFHFGEKTVWRVVRVPSVSEEDQRQLHRELMTLTRERTRQVNRIKGLLASQGIKLTEMKETLQHEKTPRHSPPRSSTSGHGNAATAANVNRRTGSSSLSRDGEEEMVRSPGGWYGWICANTTPLTAD